MPSSRKPGCSRFTRPGCRRDSLDDRNSRLESRMRENRTYGSEGGEARAFPTPISKSLTFTGVPHDFFPSRLATHTAGDCPLRSQEAAFRRLQYLWELLASPTSHFERLKSR